MSLKGVPGVARMSASETMWDAESPDVDASGASQFDFPQQELMLKRKAVLLEEFLRNGGMEPRSVEDRCQILHQRISSLEEELTNTGNLAAARRYIEHAPRLEFEAIDRDEFMAWFARCQGPRDSFLQPGQNIRAVRKRTPEHSMEDASQKEGSINPRSVSHRSKRARTSDKERPPCLRCRILKKRCDPMEQCSHCPEQSYDNSSDFWKVLGCFREPLRAMSSIFCPHFSRSIRRTLTHSNGIVEVVNLLLTKSRVSVQKRRRILNLVHTDTRFFQLIGSSWEDVSQRQSVSLAAASFEEFTDEDLPLSGKRIHPEDFEAPWSVLQAISMDPKYLTPTEYNFFDLIRQGNRFTKHEPGAWDLFRQAKRLLRQAVEIYLLERLCAHMASGDMVGPPPFYPAGGPSSNTLILVDIKDDMENFLGNFETNCSGRAKLAGHAQLACFYALLVFGIAKSMLIDAYSIRGDYEDENPWKNMDATAINSAYKALVSCFCWSSKTDVMIQNEQKEKNNGIYNAIQDTRAMVRQNQWDELGYRGTKDFLLSLGSSLSSKGDYNGFLAQKYGLGELTKASSKSVTQTAVTPAPFGEGLIWFTSASSPASHENLADSEAQAILATDNSPQQSHVSHERQMGLLEGFDIKNMPARPSISKITFVDSDNRHKPSRRHGGRKGALDADALKKAREIRKLGSCWNCWSIRMACSEGTPCDRCKKNEETGIQKCFRAPFAAFTGTFFPEFLNSQYCSRVIDEYLQVNTEAFTDDAIEAEVTWSGAVTMTLRVTPFTPTPNGTVQTNYHSRDGQSLGVESLPLGVLASDISILEQTCRSRFESGLANHPDFAALSFDRRTSDLSKSALDLVLSFHNAMQNKSPLIQDLLILYMALLTTSRPALFTEASAANILSKLHSELSPTGLYSSRLLNLQLKYIMYNLARQLTLKALGKLEKIFRSRDKSLWPVSFAATLVLCLCIEQVQVLADSYIKISKSIDASALAGLEEEPLKSCQALDGGPFAQLTHVFHLRYRTNKSDWAGLNPFRAEAFNTSDMGFEDAAMHMISGVQEKIFDNDDLLQERNMPLDFDGGAEDFAKRNSGRLVSKFLLSFIVPGEN